MIKRDQYHNSLKKLVDSKEITASVADLLIDLFENGKHDLQENLQIVKNAGPKATFEDLIAMLYGEAPPQQAIPK